MADSDRWRKMALTDLQILNECDSAGIRTLKKEYPHAPVTIGSKCNKYEYNDEARDAGAASYFTKDNLIQLKQFIHQ